MALTRISILECTPGRDVTVWTGSYGQGGTIVEITATHVTVHTPAAANVTFDLDEVTDFTIEAALPTEECLEYNPQTCTGAVDYHTTGHAERPFARCEGHQQARRARYEHSLESEANSDVAPAWFDPAYAGESWNED